MNKHYHVVDGTVIFEEWHGELGWEVMTWAPRCRKISRKFNRAIISSFPGMQALYKDFAAFETHGSNNRTLRYPKIYKVDGEYYKYGNPKGNYDVLIHARGIKRKQNYNYKNWEHVLEELKGLKVGFIGSKEDKSFLMYNDLRGIELQELMDYIAGAKVVIGVSSGVMHLAMACGTDVVVWGPDKNKTYYFEPLEKRYKEIWNPFKVNVEYIEGFNPTPKEVRERVSKIL